MPKSLIAFVNVLNIHTSLTRSQKNLLKLQLSCFNWCHNYLEIRSPKWVWTSKDQQYFHQAKFDNDIDDFDSVQENPNIKAYAMAGQMDEH